MIIDHNNTNYYKLKKMTLDFFLFSKGKKRNSSTKNEKKEKKKKKKKSAEGGAKPNHVEQRAIKK